MVFLPPFPSPLPTKMVLLHLLPPLAVTTTDAEIKEEPVLLAFESSLAASQMRTVLRRLALAQGARKGSASSAALLALVSGSELLKSKSWGEKDVDGLERAQVKMAT